MLWLFLKGLAKFTATDAIVPGREERVLSGWEGPSFLPLGPPFSSRPLTS